MQISPQLPRAGFRILALIGCASAFLAATSFATPGDDIAKAVAASGSSNVSQTSRQFLRAFNAVALRAPARELPAYVSAAIELRPALSGKIVGVAVKAAIKHWETRPGGDVCQMIGRIVTAAIAANPRAAISIAQAAVAAFPEMRTCVVEAAISAAPEREAAIHNATEFRGGAFGFLTFSEKQETGFVFSAATLSPANISDLRGDETVTSPEQPPSP